MSNINRKYNILISGNEVENIEEHSKYNCKRVEIEEARDIINKEIFDFIYYYGQDHEIVKRFKDYMLLPKAFEKFAINNDVNNTYIHCSVILDVVSNNIKIIETENRRQEIITESVLEKILHSKKDNVGLEKIFTEVQQIFEGNNVKQIISKVVYRDYAKSINQIVRFHRNKDMIIRKFFNKLVHNIQNDIEEINGFSNIPTKQVEVY